MMSGTYRHCGFGTGIEEALVNRDDVLRILVEFFRDSFEDDAVGVGDWFAQGGNDIDAFIAEVDRWSPAAK
jgi:hypothetical protein